MQLHMLLLMKSLCSSVKNIHLYVCMQPMKMAHTQVAYLGISKAASMSPVVALQELRQCVAFNAHLHEMNPESRTMVCVLGEAVHVSS